MSNIFVFTHQSDGLYIGTNLSNQKANGFIDGIQNIPSHLVIPYSYNGEIVQHIGKFAFFMCQEIQNVEIQARLVCIHYYAFNGCQNLKSVNIPSTCTFIGIGAFDARIGSDPIPYGPLVVDVEKFSVLSYIGNAGISNFKHIKMYFHSKVTPICSTYILGGASTTFLYAPLKFKFCDFETTILKPHTCEHSRIIVYVKFILIVLFEK